MYRFVDIPFEIAFPQHKEVRYGFGPCLELLPPTLFFDGSHGSGRISYELVAELDLDNSNDFIASWIFQTKFKWSQNLHPFTVYDPRMILSLMNQDIRRWKTSYGAIPVEYDVVIGN
jgi:hypothetical protein